MYRMNPKAYIGAMFVNVVAEPNNRQCNWYGCSADEDYIN